MQYTPMIPTLVCEPFHREGWVYEEKVDGWRILAYKDGARVRLLSRTGVDHAKRFRDAATATSSLPVPTLVLDGEVAIFARLHRLRSAVPRRHRPESTVLELASHATRRDRDRRRIGVSGASAAVERPGGWAAVLEHGYEGMVGKDEVSPYRGGVTRSWLKVKVPGCTDPEDRWRRMRLGEHG
jgi:bifunctional non-homologous end joining protein LigD